MDLLQYFNEEYSKIKILTGSIDAAFLQLNDFIKSFSSLYEIVLKIKIDTKGSSISQEEQDFIEQLNNVLKEYKHLVDDINKIFQSFQSNFDRFSSHEDNVG